MEKLADNPISANCLVFQISLQYRLSLLHLLSPFTTSNLLLYWKIWAKLFEIDNLNSVQMQNISFPILHTFHVLYRSPIMYSFLDYTPPNHEFSLPTQPLAIKLSTIMKLWNKNTMNHKTMTPWSQTKHEQKYCRSYLTMFYFYVNLT